MQGVRLSTSLGQALLRGSMRSICELRLVGEARDSRSVGREPYEYILEWARAGSPIRPDHGVRRALVGLGARRLASPCVGLLSRAGPFLSR